MVAKAIKPSSKELHGLVTLEKMMKRKIKRISVDPYQERRPVPEEAASSSTDTSRSSTVKVGKRDRDRPWGTLAGPKPSDFPMTQQVAMAISRREWRFYAERCLDHFNKKLAKEALKFKLLEVNGLWMDSMPDRNVHMNFTAYEEGTDQDATSRLFYAELVVPTSLRKLRIKLEIEVKGCCVIKKVSEGDPGARACGICWTHIIHPAARYGYIIESGDQIGYHFPVRTRSS